MKFPTILAAAGGALLLSAGAALADEVCRCCKDMAADAAMTCCDDMRTEPASGDAAPTAPAPAPDASTPQGHAGPN